MTGGLPSPFELATAELARLGIVLTRLPGEYRLNFRAGGESTARTVETLDQALSLGRAMAAEAPAASTPVKRRRRPLRMTPKAIRRRMIRRHNRRLRARAIRQQLAADRPDDKQ